MFFRGGGGCAHGAGTHPVLTDVMPLNAGTLQTEAPFAAAGAVRPREVTGLADDLPARFARAPELGAVLHVRAGLGAHPESQLTLLVQAVTRPRKVFGQRNGFGRLVQQAVSCGSGDGGLYWVLGTKKACPVQKHHQTPRFLLTSFAEGVEELLYSPLASPGNQPQGWILLPRDRDTGKRARDAGGLTVAAVEEVGDDGSAAG